jgi:hypothetical protein
VKQDFGVETPAAPVPRQFATVYANTAIPFAWDLVPGADHYSVSVDDLTTGQLGVFSSPKVAYTYFDPGVPLAAGHTYRWRVQAFDHLGNVGPWSATVQFTVL